MQTACGRNLLLWTVSLVFSVSAIGCTVNFNSFSMDSVSKVPFFGFELKEWRPKSKAPSYTSISRTEWDVSRIEPALQTETTAIRPRLNLGLKYPFSPKFSATTARDESGPTSVAIPQTASAGAFSALDRSPRETTLDFQ